MKTRNKSFLFGYLLAVGLTLLFLVLRLTGIISWSWWVVFSPLLLYAAVFTVTLITIMRVYSNHRKP